MSQSFKVLFFLKKGKRCNVKSLPIYVRVTINGQRAGVSREVVSLVQNGIKLLEEPREIKKRSKFLTPIWMQFRVIFLRFKRNMTYAMKPLSAEHVRSEILNKKEEKQHSLIEVYKYHNNQFEKLVGLEFAHGTFKKFKSALKSLKDFIEWKFNKKDAYLTEVNHKFITDYEFYLKAVQKLQHNSAMGNIKKLKKIIRQCVANDWLDKDPFKSYKITTKETHRNFLLKDELELLMNKKLPVQRLDQVRDIFLFSCYTGLSYSDVMMLTRKDISIGIDGEQWIFTKRTKTDAASRIPLLPISVSSLSYHKQGHQYKCWRFLFTYFFFIFPVTVTGH